MKKLTLPVLAAIAVLANSCDLEFNEKYDYCVLTEKEICLLGPFESCDNGGMLSNSCPYSSNVIEEPYDACPYYGEIEYGSLVYEGQTYKTVAIGSQTWMAENLNLEVEGSVCYDNEPENCDTYGWLYNWESAMNICPEGWHLPDDNEWLALKKFVEDDCKCYNCVGTKLKANSELWVSGKGTDNFGFSALPGGFYRDDSRMRGGFMEKNELAVFWSTTTGSEAGSAHVRMFKYNHSLLTLDGFFMDSSLAYIRCVRD
ncbi:MAG: fibrobacter succinogenes major paralogous domain-containing protein [Fibromonadaceae bacterium]|jgi:uncharacterized protein (TIGR02145 family)|nr:fibrobacter succinogenes major paralogous domain-containing protein [Fibromonadaceae bacterium]